MPEFPYDYMPEPNSGCWLWLGSCYPFGYGQLTRNQSVVPGETMAHRVSWVVHRGPITKAQWVLHRCDTPACVNPDHLFLGDSLTNVRDMIAKGRKVVHRGEANARAKLTESGIWAIRRDPRRAADIAADHGIVASIVIAIKNRKIWRHLPDDGTIVKLPRGGPPGNVNGRGGRGQKLNLTDEERARRAERMRAVRLLSRRGQCGAKAR